MVSPTIVDQRRADGGLRHLLTLEQLSRSEIECLLDRAQSFVRPLGYVGRSNAGALSPTAGILLSVILAILGRLAEFSRFKGNRY